VPWVGPVNYKNPTALFEPQKVHNVTASQIDIFTELNKLDTYDGSKPFFLSVKDKHLLQNIIYRIVGKDHLQCFNASKGEKNNLINKIQVEKYISEGSYGRVFIGCFPVTVKTTKGAACGPNSLRIAVKSYEVLPYQMTDTKKRYLDTPNLPFLYNWYFFVFFTPWYTAKSLNGVPAGCMILLTELAKADMFHMYKDELMHMKSIDDSSPYDAPSMFLLCSLFQIMNGLNAMQQYPQIIHRDIKAQNMLVHNVKSDPNQYIHYNVNGVDYWLPNIGTVAMISDFGLCVSVSPEVPLVVKDPLDPTAPSIRDNRALKNLGQRPGVIMGKKGEERLSLFGILDQKLGSVPNPNNCIFLKNWQGASDNFAATKQWHPKLDAHYGMTVLKQNADQVGTFELHPISDEVVLIGTEIDDMHMLVKPDQKEYLKKLGITSDPTNLDFYNHVQQIPSVETVIDTQDALRTFAGGGRAAYGAPHMAAPWTLGPLLSKQSIEILSEVSKYTTLGPESDFSGLDTVRIFPDSRIGSIILSDNPAHLLASYFIRDFKFFDIFKKKPPASAKIIGSFKQPNGNGTIRFT